MTRVGGLLFGCVALCASFASQAPAQSVDCHKATEWSDMMVCGNPNLTALNAKVDTAYRDAQNRLSPTDAEEVRRVHDAWMKGREKCEEDPDPTKCLEQYYQRHIQPIVQPGQ